MLRHGWRTGAIIPELEREIRIINTEQYMHSLTWQQALTGLLERMQVGGGGLVDWSCRSTSWMYAHHLPAPCFPRLIRTQSHGRFWLPG